MENLASVCSSEYGVALADNSASSMAFIHRKLADELGWRRANDWLRYDDFTLSLEAKEGHLPSFGYSVQRWDEWEPSFRSFFLRVSTCMQQKVVD